MRNKSAALLILLATAAACSKKTADSAVAADSTEAKTAKGSFTVTPEQQSRIHLVVATKSSFQPSIEATGTVAFNGDRSTQVLSPVSGPVSRLFVEVGAPVSRGTPLAAVASPDFAAAIATYRKAQATYRNLQKIADQDEQLFKTDAIARRDVEAAQVEAQGAAADRDAALEQLRALGVNPSAVADGSANNVTAMIRSPIEGVVVERNINPGQLLQAGSTPAFTIADLSSMWVLANVFEADLPNIRRGQMATVSSSAMPAPITGRVDYVAALVDPASRATSVRITVPNHNQQLKRDMYVRVSINSDLKRTGILVPEASVLRDEQNLPFVFVETTPGHYSRRSITLGAHVGSNYEVASGLTVGEKVVAEGALFLQFAESQ
jgi:cobalt-zinc-cadmium efflux system membrane fusion protein